MAKTVSKIIDKITKVSESYTIYMYDNGFMMEIGGSDHKDDWKTAKIMVPTVEELIVLIKEAASKERRD